MTTMTPNERSRRALMCKIREKNLTDLLQSNAYQEFRGVLKDRLDMTLRRMERENDQREWDRLSGAAKAYREIIGDRSDLDSILFREIELAHQEANRLGAGLT